MVPRRKVISAFLAPGLLVTGWSGQVQGRALSEWQVLGRFPADLIEALPRWVIRPEELAAGNGALGLNRKGYLAIGNQRHASEFVIQGVLTHNPVGIASALKTIDYAFAQQKPDGSFPDYQPKANPRSSASSVAFFLQDLGHALALLQQSPWFLSAPETRELRNRVRTIQPQAALTLQWLLQNQDNLYRNDRQTANRLLIDASAYYMAARALQNDLARQAGLLFLERGLQLQTEDGYFQEKGGYDSSYNAVSLQLLLQIYCQFGDEPQAAQDRLWSAINRGFRWQMSRIQPDGQVATDGNTRVYPGGEQYFDRAKGVDYNSLCLALGYYASLSDDPRATEYARRVFKYRQKGK